MSSHGENTYKKFVYAINRLQVINKFKDISKREVPYRWFNTGLVKSGRETLNENEVISIMLYVRHIFKKAGFICCRESAFYEMQDIEVLDYKKVNIKIDLLRKISAKETNYSLNSIFVKKNS